MFRKREDLINHLLVSFDKLYYFGRECKGVDCYSTTVVSLTFSTFYEAKRLGLFNKYGITFAADTCF